MMKPKRSIKRTGAAIAACSAFALASVALVQPAAADGFAEDGWETTVDEVALSEQRGGTVQTNIAGSDLSQTATNVLVGDATAGHGIFASGALSNNKMSMTVVNTGNNNIMQNSMNVQVNFHGM